MEDLKGISLEKYKFPPSIFMSKKEGRFTMIERMMRVYSVLLSLSGIFLLVYPKILRRELSSKDIVSLTAIILGLLILVFSSRGIRRWFLGKSDEPEGES